ncbi:Hypothetical predicted protein [Drosophila guanche]|uniref:Uncharacterized protein n=1 Tax=Drosophila guanche TaxID=7266 RepID=A0A3B0JZ15_DROGU|nr:Hypothetical predicted protein [Drosophila guanche]
MRLQMEQTGSGGLSGVRATESESAGTTSQWTCARRPTPDMCESESQYRNLDHDHDHDYGYGYRPEHRWPAQCPVSDPKMAPNREISGAHAANDQWVGLPSP